jgi:hypothetical protein
MVAQKHLDTPRLEFRIAAIAGGVKSPSNGFVFAALAL